MKIEKLRKNHKKEIIIGTILVVVIGGALTFKLTHSKYRTTQSINLATGTINYTVPDFQIMAMYKSEDGENYIDTNTVPASGYTLNTSKSGCKVLDAVDSSVTIEYIDGKINFLGATQKGTKCYLYFDKKTTETINTPLGPIEVQLATPDFSKTSCKSGCGEATVGVYKAEDGMYGGTTYYWRGDTEDNYVKFAGFCWRIIRINGDKTIRLIYDGSTCHANGAKTAESIAVTNQKYNSNMTKSNYVGWTYDGELQRTLSGTDSNAKSQTETWYNNNIGNNATYSAKIVDGKFCNDRNVQSENTWTISGSTFYYAAYKRIYTDYSPTFDCPSGDAYTLKVGAITADEVEFAGGKSANSSYYLYNGQNYWTMSPYGWENRSGWGVSAWIFFVSRGGYLSGLSYSDDGPYGIRPVINLRSDITFSSGNGTQNNPYTVS